MKQKTAETILKENIHAWGEEKKVFFASQEEIIILFSEGATVILLNHDNGDGTYNHELSYNGYMFKCSTSILIEK